MIVTVSSSGGSPGVTSWALLLAAAWPSSGAERAVTLEADPDGGVLGARYGVGVDPGVVGLIASCRRDEAFDLDAAARYLGEGHWVIPSPESAEHLWPMWAGGASDLARRLAADERVWIVDLGRLSPGSPVWPIARHAAINVLLARSETESLLKLPTRVARLNECNGSTVVLVAGPAAHSADELAAFCDADEGALVPSSDHLPQLVAKCIGGGRARRHIVWRTAVDVARQLDRIAAAPNLPQADQMEIVA